MRALASALSLLLAAQALAEQRPPGGDRSGGSPRATAPAPPLREPQALAPPSPRGPRVAAPGTHPVLPAPPPGTPRYRYPYRYYPYGPYFYPYYPYYGVPFWWGWGWGWGYYPVYPRPAYPYVEEAQRISTEMTFRAGPTRAHYPGYFGSQSNEIAAGIEIFIDGTRFGLVAAVDGFSLGSAYTGPFTNAGSLATGSIHGTYALASGKSGRLRAELGAAVVSWPDTDLFRGPSQLGPDVGLSGHLGLIGPLGISAHVRYTPFPRYVVDLESSLTLRLGPLGLKGGWRHVALGGDSTQPSLRFTGPQFGLSFLF